MRNPWLDVNQYAEEQHIYFKGRSLESVRFSQIVYRETLSVLYANSGIGKSSFINAGIIPQLKAMGLNISPVHIVFDDEFFDQKKNVEEYVYGKLKQTIKWKYRLKKEVKGCQKSLWWLLHEYQPQAGNNKTIPIIIFDQFEEVFVKGDSDFLSKLFALIEELSFHSLPPIVNDALSKLQDDTFIEVNNQHHYRILFSLRKEYLADFDYWTNERYSIPQLLRNRMLLPPFTITQAEEVITSQPLVDESNKIVDGKYVATLNQVKAEIISKLDPNGKGFIEPSLLSVICYRLFEKTGGDPEMQITQKDLNSIGIDRVLRDFYESQIEAVIRSRKRMYLLEKCLLDERGIRKRPEQKELNDKGFSDDILEQLKNHHIIRTEKPLKSSGEKNWVELIHDKIADVVKERITEYENNKRNQIIRWILISIVLIASIYSLLGVISTNDKNKVMSNLTCVKDREFTTDDTLWIDSQHLHNNSMVETISIIDKDEYNISNCQYLSTVDLSKLGKNDFVLKLKNCQLLQKIIMPDSIRNLSLVIEKCPNLQIHVTKGIGSLTIDAPNEDLSVRVDPDVRNYVWYDKVLWNMDIFEVVYCFVPDKTEVLSKYFPQSASKVSSIGYKGIKINNLGAVADERSTSSVSIRGGNSFTFSKREIKEYKSVQFWDDESSITEKLFYHSNKLENVVLSSKLSYIFPSAFEGCIKLSNVQLPNSLYHIGKRAFYGCKSLKEIVIPSSVAFIGDLAFANCDSLESVKILSPNIQIGKRAFYGCKNLKMVVLPPNVKYVIDYFSYPFLGCPRLGFLDNFEISSKPGVISKNKNATFYETGQIQLENDPKELHFPISMERRIWDFLDDPVSLTDIYLPYPQPNIVRHNEKIIFNIDISDELKGKIVLHVPYGCRRYYESIPAFSSYRQIEECDVLSLYVNNSLSIIYGLFQLMMAHIIIGLLLLSLSVFIIYSLCVFRQERRNYKLFIISVILMICAFFLILAFITQILKMDGVSALALAMFITIILMSYLMLQGKISRIIKLPKFPKPSKKVIYVSLFVPSLLLVFAVIICTMRKDSMTIESAVAKSDYRNAICLMYEELKNASSIDKGKVMHYRSILIQSGVLPEITLKGEFIFDDKNYRPIISQHGLGKPNYLIQQLDDSIKIWDEFGYRQIKKPVNPFINDAVFNIDMQYTCMTYYDNKNDSTVLYDLNKQSAVPLHMKGMIDNDIPTARPFNYYLTKTRDGKQYLYSKKGIGVELPSLPEMNGGYHMGNEDYHLETVASKGSKYETLIYGILDNKPVFRKFYSEHPRQLTKDGYLIVDKKSPNALLYYSSSKNFEMDSIIVNGVVEGYGNGHIYYTKNKERFLYNIDHEYNIPLESKFHDPNAAFYGFIGSRYFYLKSTGEASKAFKYPKIYIFDMLDDYKMIRRFEGDDIVECPNDYIAILQDSIRHYYNVSNGSFYKGGSSPRTFHDPIDIRYKGEQIDVEGNFAVLYNRIDDKSTYILYPLLDKNVAPITFQDWQPIISKNDIIQWDWVRNMIIISHYDTLQDLINKTPYLSGSEKKEVNSHLNQLGVEW